MIITRGDDPQGVALSSFRDLMLDGFFRNTARIDDIYVYPDDFVAMPDKLPNPCVILTTSYDEDISYTRITHDGIYRSVWVVEMLLLLVSGKQTRQKSIYKVEQVQRPWGPELIRFVNTFRTLDNTVEEVNYGGLPIEELRGHIEFDNKVYWGSLFKIPIAQHLKGEWV